MKKWHLIVFAVLITAGLIEMAIVIPQDYKNKTGMFTPARANNAVYSVELTSDDTFTAETEKVPETSEIEVEEEDEQTASEEEVQQNISDGLRQGVESLQMGNATEVATEVESVQEATDSRQEVDGFRVYGIWSGAYWHFTPEEIDNQWAGLKPSKPKLPEGTTRAWQRYLYDKLAEIGAEHFYKIAVAQAMQESGLNQQGNDAVPDKGLFSFRVYYWNSAYGDIFDYRANIDAYIARIAPYLNDRSEQGIYRALSQHFQPDGQIHYDYVTYVLGRLNELWEME